jgi:hypothetical protein
MFFYFPNLQYWCGEHLNIYFSKTNIIFRDMFGVFFQVEMVWYNFFWEVTRRLKVPMKTSRNSIWFEMLQEGWKFWKLFFFTLQVGKKKTNKVKISCLQHICVTWICGDSQHHLHEVDILVSWSMDMNDVVESFKLWCGLSNVHGVINDTHILIFKLQTFLLKGYYFHKTWSYSIVVQHVADCNKKFLDLCVGLPNNVNDVKMLCKFALYRHVQSHGLFDLKKGVDGFPSYFLNDKAYPQLDNDTFQKKNVACMILELFYHKKHKRRRSIVENVFNILINSFK